MTRRSLPTRARANRTTLDQLRKQTKDLLHRSLLVACCVLFVGVSIVAQSPTVDPVSGNWGTDSATRLELKFDGKGSVSGTAIWRNNGRDQRTSIKTGTFDVKTRTLKLEGEGTGPDGAVGRYIIESTVDGETMTGTVVFGDFKGTFMFTKRT